jgi:hypothetical protein
MIRRLIALTVISTVVGCATIQPVSSTRYQSPAVSTSHKIDTSYTVGVPIESFVGERMLRVQDYYVNTYTSGNTSTRLLPSQPFVLRVPPLMSVSLAAQDEVEIVGTTIRNGTTYRVISIPAAATQQLRFLITDDGALEGSALNSAGARMGWTYKADPDSVRFLPAPPSVKVDSEKGFTNFELVYGGTAGDSFQILYREYTKEDLARPAFSQSLVYEKESEDIRFRNLQIKVLEASNQKIKFTVLSDTPSREP